MSPDLYDKPVQYVKGIGPKRARLLARLGIKTILDALYYLPSRYEDRRNIKKIADLANGAFQTVEGRVVAKEVQNTRRGLKIFELLLNDGTGLIKGKWFNQSYLDRVFKAGERVLLSGTVRRDYRWGVGWEMLNPDYEAFPEESGKENIHTSRIVPVYRVTEGLGQRAMRAMMFSIISSVSGRLTEYMPEEVLRRTGLPGLEESFLYVHFPGEEADLESLQKMDSPYHRRIAFDELFCLETGRAVLRGGRAGLRGIAFDGEGELVKKVQERLPFELTGAQKRVLREIFEDMAVPRPMNRLIQGDVGSGKTIVALLVMLNAVQSGYQAAIMAPTEILAEQHYRNMAGLLTGVDVRVALLTGSLKDRPTEEIKKGEVQIVVGTHALIQEEVEFRKLGLVVIDEQHRFGVLQRASLRKKGLNPDVLVMTATPIPRTMALTLYGDLDTSVIDELPPGRKPVKTRLFFEREKSRLYDFIRDEIRKGRQAYIVYPAIEESEKLNLRSAIPARDALERIFPKFRIGLLHGRMRPGEREEVMNAFKAGEVDILVSTTVVEVGVDVPNATVMLIVHAERFGLSQLHQLRGRVGRGADQSWCLLLAYGRLSDEALQRLRVMVKYTDGFRIAEEDFRLRGPGELFGTRQSGLPDLRVADLTRAGDLLIQARREAFRLVGKDPLLERSPGLRGQVERFWREKMEIFRTS